MAEKTSRKDLAFARFAAANPDCKGRRLATEFEVQASFAMGICNHWQYLKLEENDKRWDEVCNGRK